MAARPSIELANEGTGPRVITTQIRTPQPVDSAGNVVADQVLNQQLITLAGPTGDFIGDIGPQLLGELRTIRELLVTISAQLE